MFMVRKNTTEAVAETSTPSVDEPTAVAASTALEDQLARIITAARNVAVVAEELLRDVSASGIHAGTAPHAVSMAPRLLAATEQQLASVAAMLRQG
jgi:uncharacterized membrane protein